MKKSIRTKVIVMIAGLLAVFMLRNAISQITLNNLGDTMSQVTNVYMELEKLNKELIQEEETSKLYANLIVLTEN